MGQSEPHPASIERVAVCDRAPGRSITWTRRSATSASIWTRDWSGRILGQLQHYRKQAPYFDTVSSLVRECLDPDETHVAAP